MSSPFYDPFKGQGRLLYAYPDKAVWALDLDDGQIVTCTQRLVEPIIEDNQRAYNDSAGKRWGEGRHIANWPLSFYFKHIMPARRNGDEAYIKRLLNDIDYRKFRRFPGRL